MLKPKVGTVNSYLEILLICLLSSFLAGGWGGWWCGYLNIYMKDLRSKDVFLLSIYSSSVNLPSVNRPSSTGRVPWKRSRARHGRQEAEDLFLRKPLQADKSGKIFCEPGEGTHHQQPFSNLSRRLGQYPSGIITRWTSGSACAPRGCGNGTDPGSFRSLCGSCWMGRLVRTYTWACGSSWQWGTEPLQPHSVDPGSITNEVIQEWIWKRRQ